MFYVENDPLAGVRRNRVIVQHKHWLSKSVALPDVAHHRDKWKVHDGRDTTG